MKRDLKAETRGQEQNKAKAKSSDKKEDSGAKQTQAKARGGDKKEGIGDNGIKDCEKHHNQCKAKVGAKKEGNDTTHYQAGNKDSGDKNHCILQA